MSQPPVVEFRYRNADRARDYGIRLVPLIVASVVVYYLVNVYLMTTGVLVTIGALLERMRAEAERVVFYPDRLVFLPFFGRKIELRYTEIVGAYINERSRVEILTFDGRMRYLRTWDDSRAIVAEINRRSNEANPIVVSTDSRTLEAAPNVRPQ